jgi:thiamine-phosphate pyrophosphorylase
MPIVDVDAAARAAWSPVDLARAYVNGGATFLQLRAKRASSAELLDLARAVVRIAHARGATVVVNDRVDVARLAGADGVHVGQDDLSAADVRTIMGPDAVVGLSTHTTAQLTAAVREPVTYVAIGPVFATTSKSTGYDALGLDAVRAAAAIARAAHLPLVAIGGITFEHGRAVIDAGATSVAVISDLLLTADPTQRTREFVTRLSRSAQPER